MTERKLWQPMYEPALIAEGVDRDFTLDQQRHAIEALGIAYEGVVLVEIMPLAIRVLRQEYLGKWITFEDVYTLKDPKDFPLSERQMPACCAPITRS